MLFSIDGVARLTREPELRYLSNGTALLKLGLACSQKRKDGNGNTQEDKCFIDGVLFGKRAEALASWMNKGSRIQIKGLLKYETWTAQDGSNRNKHTIAIDNIELMNSKNDSQHNQGYDYTPPPNPAPNNHSPEHTQNRATASMDRQIPEIDIETDEVPF